MNSVAVSERGGSASRAHGVVAGILLGILSPDCQSASEPPLGGSGGSPPPSGGAPGTGGTAAATGGRSGTGGEGGALPHFSFFVTSLEAMKRLSGNPLGFGGDLRYGQASGLEGADKICHDIAETAMPGAGAKTWRAFLSVVGPPVVNAIDRVGEGPWYDRLGRLVASTKANLMKERPADADPTIKDDLPNESGIPNHMDGAPGCTERSCPDNHDTLTGTGPAGQLYKNDMTYTCNDWTSSAMSGRPWCGHCWPRQGSGRNWMSALAEGGCAPGVNLMESGGPMPGKYDVGTGGGYGGIYCFALTP